MPICILVLHKNLNVEELIKSPPPHTASGVLGEGEPK